MARKGAAAAKTRRKGEQAPDPRFSALARLLARDLARRHLDEGDNLLSRSQSGAYDADTSPEDAS